VVRDTEDNLNVVGCLESRGYCRIERACVLRGVPHEATEAFLAVLDGHTLADLIKPQRVAGIAVVAGPVRCRASGLTKAFDERYT
jgi:Rrf2 family transcriptional regulator, nitric oxide-sensitive transcriptional repressor